MRCMCGPYGNINMWWTYASDITSNIWILRGMDVVVYTCFWHTSTLCHAHGKPWPYRGHMQTMWCSSYGIHVTLFGFLQIVYGIDLVLQYGLLTCFLCAFHMGNIKIWLPYASDITNTIWISSGINVVVLTCFWHTSAIWKADGIPLPYWKH